LDSTNHGTIAINANGSVTYTPNNNYVGLDTFEYRVCETCGTITSCDNAFGYIRVDSVCQGPIANADFDTTGYLCNDTISVLTNDVNLPIGSTVTIVKPAQYGQSYVLNNEVVYVPNGTQKNGADSIVYSVCNICDKCDTGTLYIKLTGYGCNVHHPNLTNDTIRICRNTDTLISVLANDKDVDGNGIHISSFLPGNNGMVTKVGDSLLYHPNNNFTGTDVFVYQACDDGDPTLCNTAEVYIIVDACRNDTPVVHQPVVDTTFVNVPITVCLDSVTDANGDSVFISSVCKPQHGVITGFSGLCFTYQPDSSFVGNDTFCVTVCDNGRPLPACTTIPVVITVLPKDSTILVDSVFANNDVSATNAGTPVTIPVLNNDGFTPNPGTTQTGTAIVVDEIVANPKNGTVVVNPDGTITYTPNEQFCGIDTFQYSIKDNGFPVQRDTAYVYVYVCGTPVVKAVDDNGNCTDTTTTVGSTTDINVLANDTIPFANDTTVTIYNAPDNGTASVNKDHTVHYIPRDGFIGNDNFEYIVCATVGEKVICDTAYVCVNVADTPKVVPCYFPNGFSPNGDGANDVFAYPCNNQYPNATLKVFNRWGDEVWRSEGSYKNDWNGTNMQGTVLPDGTYYFIYTYNDGSGKSEAKFVVLHR
jgi:gliding motility-associated-like protein